MVIKRDIVSDVDRVMSRFFATATDAEFWSELEDAGWADFSKIDVPVLDYHSKAARYRVTAVGMSVPEGAIASATIFSSKAIQEQVVISGCAVTVEAANSNELALAA
jgi:hypothetical protein